MKTAICFSGTARALEYTHENLQNCLLDTHGEVDTFFHVAENNDSFKVEKYFNPTALRIEKDPPVEEEELIFYPGIRGTKKQYLRMLHSRKKVNELRLDYEKENHINYDCIIASRLDVKYFTSVDDSSKLDLNYVYIPDFHGFSKVLGGGYNDRFAIGNSANMDIYFRLYDYLRPYCLDGHIIHGETTLHHHLVSCDIKTKYIPVRFTRVRENGDQIDDRLKSLTTWGEGDGL